MVSEFLYYRHIVIKGILRPALRVVEDVTMICLMGVYGNDGILNDEKCETRQNFKEHGLKTELDEYKVGAFILAQLLENPKIL